MRKYIILITLLAMCLQGFAQSADTKTATAISMADGTSGYLCNPPLPQISNNSRLNVLFVGNSFAIDTATALPEILKSLGIANVSVFVLYHPGCSMKQHYENFKSGKKEYELHQFNSTVGAKIENKISINSAFSRTAYDIVVFQQYSLESGNYASYEPYLSRLIQAYNITKVGSRTTFAFNQTWAYSSKKKEISRYGTPLDMWRSICTSVQKMKKASGIDVIIPVGTAVQNARSVAALQTDKEFTRDNHHLDNYMGRYLAACTFFEAIIAPCTGKNLRDDKTVYGKDGEPNQVNDTNRRLLQNCARSAVANNYEISEFAGL